jgi:hypothetical protein
LNFSKTNQKKEILISNSLLEIFDHLLYEELIRKGDSITAFLVEHNDVHKVIKANTTNDKKSSDEYLQVFSTALQRD